MGGIAARLRSGVVDRRWGLVSKTGGLCVAGWSRSWAVARGREPGPAQPAKRAAGERGWAPRVMRWALWGDGRVWTGLAAAGACWQRDSVLPPWAAWRMRMRWARAATQALFQNEQAGAFSGWLLGDDVRPVSYGTAKAMQPVEGDLLEFSFAECGRCRRERIARHRSFDHLRTSNDFVVIEWRFH